LIESYKKGKLDLSKVTTFNLDEYIGLKKKHPASYSYFMNQELFKDVNVPKKNINVPCGAQKMERYGAYCKKYEKMINTAGGIDLQILGIGTDGHIGFNEPGTPLDSRTHLAELAPQTIEDNARYFHCAKDVPTLSVTMGVATILEARKIILLASGVKKAEAIRDAINGPMSCNCTASALQSHPDVTFLLDSEAASLLKKVSVPKLTKKVISKAPKLVISKAKRAAKK